MSIQVNVHFGENHFAYLAKYAILFLNLFYLFLNKRPKKQNQNKNVYFHCSSKINLHKQQHIKIKNVSDLSNK